MNATDCKANKSLRVTVKVFIKNLEEKRRREAEPPRVETTESADTPQLAEAQSAAAEMEASASVQDGMPAELQDDAATAAPDTLDEEAVSLSQAPESLLLLTSTADTHRHD